MLSSLAIVLLAAAPKAQAEKPVPPPPPPAALPAELPEFRGDLPSLNDVARPPPKGGLVGGELTKVLFPEKCEAGTAVDLSRTLHVSMNTLEKVQAWLDATPGLEEKLFDSKGTLGEVARLVGGSKAVPEQRCPLSTDEGWKLATSKVGTRPCERTAGRLGDFWWFHADKPAGVVAVSPGKAGNNCAVRLSSMLFDQKGKTRLQVHNDLQAPPSFTLLGDWCRNVEFKFDEKLNGFKARPTKCKP
jgi:hypothetical protein